MQVISIISTKGGEGKSTHAANLSGFLADAGLKTLLIDGDYAQPTASSYYSLRYEAPYGLYELLMQTVDLNAPEQIISHTGVSNLDLIVSNDPHEQLKTSMMHAPDGRIRLRNLLQHPLLNAYDVVVIDSQGARSIMLELVLLATNHTALAMIKPVVPDVREFLRGTIPLLEGLLPYRGFGIVLPPVKVLVNCMDYTTLAKDALEALSNIIAEGSYSSADISVSLLDTQIYDLDVYKTGHSLGQPAHRLEYHTDRKSLPAARTMHDLACELFPEWAERFASVLQVQPKGDK
ncbi:TPA: ParA family protein [Klebsiella pneumoniae]|uniref:ParA family protein n=1 Tax=Klebsiella pneumoniae complex TaxID=3390273 RepID=UPI000DE6FF18|nr:MULTISPECIES: ParA family protein [Klebsiella]HDS2595430.1 ParA family protein [Klebsiella pneumoniae subsp. pneumoniae]MDG3468729.1 ParA family protein [Klebsiella pneumoniae]MDS0189485.1 ParA family protein [Klebsiella pneumoniae]MDS1045889.1 ParA family protein [Klebsiella pneumoniae]MDS1064390.1 ParA family protein [Klebsiella pneumoniae]